MEWNALSLIESEFTLVDHRHLIDFVSLQATKTKSFSSEMNHNIKNIDLKPKKLKINNN